MIGPLDRASFLEKPKRLVPPFPWIEHIPFAFFFIDLFKPRLFVELGVHSGNSYNAFCQAVASIESGTTCYGIDTWLGDEQAGFYEDDVFQELQEYQEREYGAFSYLLRMTFDEALASFSDGSIDLLHIDGLHTYEAVKRDFENWLPKMTPRGVVLLHDTQERSGRFGVWQVWEEVNPRYPSFEFKYGHGLGVLAVGDNIEPEILAFIRGLHVKSTCYRTFYRLGNSLLTEQCALDEARSAKTLSATCERRAQAMESYAHQLQDYVKVKDEEIELFRVQTGDLLAHVKAQQGEIERLGLQVGDLLENVSLKDEEISRFRNHVGDLLQDIRLKAEEIGRLSRYVGEVEEYLRLRDTEIESLGSEIRSLKAANESTLASRLRRIIRGMR
jgi:O-antigen biosynthesis protein